MHSARCACSRPHAPPASLVSCSPRRPRPTANTEALPKAESMTPAPVSPYAAGKVAAEQLLTVWARAYVDAHGGAAVLQRLRAAPKRDDSPYTGVIAIFARALLEGRSPTIHRRRRADARFHLRRERRAGESARDGAGPRARRRDQRRERASASRSTRSTVRWPSSSAAESVRSLRAFASRETCATASLRSIARARYSGTSRASIGARACDARSLGIASSCTRRPDRSPLRSVADPELGR